MSVEKASSWVGSTDGEIIELAGSEPPASAENCNELADRENRPKAEHEHHYLDSLRIIRNKLRHLFYCQSSAASASV